MNRPFGLGAVGDKQTSDLIAMDISISVVSHLQMTLVAELLGDLAEHCRDSRFELILTLNQDETIPFIADSFSYPIKVLKNATPLGFGANQNQAFAHGTGRFFCVINPDIRLTSDPFPALLACMNNSSVGVVAPLVLGENGTVEDSARRFPSPLKILRKVFGGGFKLDYAMDSALVHPDWVAGMFMLFPRGIFERLGGFDERYFLYYEDVDICARLRLLGHAVLVCPEARVMHHAQRRSHRDFRHLRWHLKSMVRFFLSPVYWRIR